MRQRWRWIGAALGLILWGASGCGGCGNSTVDEDMRPEVSDMAPARDMRAARPDQGADLAGGDMRQPPEQVCTPGEFLGCREENSPAVDVCNSQGTGPEPGACPSGRVCRQGACVAVSCVPGTRTCGGVGGGAPGYPRECDEAGEDFVDLEPCQEGTRCEDGFCLNRCELSRISKSYIGCEYWAVELENHLLYNGSIAEDRLPPFGIVLANTSETYDARVTVYDAEGQIAEAYGERTVGLDRNDPSIVFEQVRSQVVDAEGRVLRELGGPVDGVPLPRGSVMTLLMPHKRIPFGESAVGNFGYKVESTQPVVAYQFNPLCCNYNTTNDASLLLPEGVLTRDYMFLGYAVFAGNSISRLDQPWSPTLTVVGTEPDTEVTITLPPPRGEGRPYTDLIYPEGVRPGGGEADMGEEMQMMEPGRIQGPDEAGVIRATLQPFEVLNLGGRGVGPVEDLTGARIEASAPVAAFSGHSCAYVPYTLGFCDHIESQLFPLETWGRRFVLAPLKLRNPEATSGTTREATYWKFLARQDDTRILTGIDLRAGPQGTLRPADEGVPSCEEFSLEPAQGLIELDAGESCEFGTRRMLLAQSNHPIAIGAFLSGQDSVFEDAQPGDRAGDPAFFFVPPEEQYRRDYSLLTPKTYFQNFVTVTIQAGFGVVLDGQTLDLSQFDTEALPEEGFVRAHIPLEEGPHRLEADIPFGIVVYGYDDYVSYAFTGGLNLTKLSEL